MSVYRNPTWYKDAVFYELYVRAFKDGSGDMAWRPQRAARSARLSAGAGRRLRVAPADQPSPLFDDGYDVADYRGIHEDFGTLEDFKAIVDGVHQRGMYIIIDIVLNHTPINTPGSSSRASRKTRAQAQLVRVE